jgi:hypothetical protein
VQDNLTARNSDDAVRCYQVNFDARSPSKKQQFSEARGWLFHDEDSGPFSFRKVCDASEIDPDYVRRGLTSWKVKRLGEKVTAIRRRQSLSLAAFPNHGPASQAATSPVNRARNGRSRRIRLAQTLTQKAH